MHSQLYPDTFALLEELKRAARPIFLITGSDVRLKLSEKGLIYDPGYSIKKKRQRLNILRKRLNLHYTETITGDPDDKPSEEFFKRAVGIARRTVGFIDLRKAVAVGDSYEADLRIPQGLGFGRVVLLDRVGNLQEHTGVNKISNLTELTDLFSS